MKQDKTDDHKKEKKNYLDHKSLKTLKWELGLKVIIACLLFAEETD